MEIKIGCINGTYFILKNPISLYGDRYITYNGEKIGITSSPELILGLDRPTNDSFKLVEIIEEPISVGDLSYKEYKEKINSFKEIIEDEIATQVEALKAQYELGVFQEKYAKESWVYVPVMYSKPIDVNIVYLGDKIDVPFTEPLRLLNDKIREHKDITLYKLEFSPTDIIKKVIKDFENDNEITISDKYSINNIEFDKFDGNYISYNKYISGVSRGSLVDYFTVKAIGTEAEVRETYYKRYHDLYNALTAFYTATYVKNPTLVDYNNFLNTLNTIKNHVTDMEVMKKSLVDKRQLLKRINEDIEKIVEALK